jgi:serine/threonine protein kinase
MIGQNLGPYRVLDKVGACGVGEFYRAHDERSQRDVVLKLLSTDNDEVKARVLGDAHAAAALEHQHICTIYDVGEFEGQAYVAMEQLDGTSLDRAIPSEGLDIGNALDLGLQIVAAVAHAHEHGVLHRGLRAAQIIVTPAGVVKVMDFGCAQRLVHREEPGTNESSLSADASHTADGIAYLAPEQLRGEAGSAASDVWALGVVLHELVAGERPFSGATSAAISSAILERPPRPLPHTVPTILRGLLSRCLAKDPSRRYTSAKELQSALSAIRAGSDVTPYALASAARDEDRQRWWIVTGALAIIAALAFIVLLARAGW